jgi:hypothetical protein
MQPPFAVHAAEATRAGTNPFNGLTSSSTSQESSDRFDVLREIQRGNLPDAWSRLHEKVIMAPAFLYSYERLCVVGVFVK